VWFLIRTKSLGRATYTRNFLAQSARFFQFEKQSGYNNRMSNKQRSPNENSKYERLHCSVDILKDGSSPLLGPLGSVFVSIIRASAYGGEDIHDPFSCKLLKRYMFGECCENIGRLCADQKQSLKINGIFLPGGLECLAGFPSLLYSLTSSGAESTTVVCPADNSSSGHIELVRNVVLGPRKSHPKVQICEVPASCPPVENQLGSSKRRKIAHQSWWNVYEDEYIQIQATACQLGTRSSLKLDEKKSCKNDPRSSSCLSSDSSSSYNSSSSSDSSSSSGSSSTASSSSSTSSSYSYNGEADIFRRNPFCVAYCVTFRGSILNSFVIAPQGMSIQLPDPSSNNKLLKFVMRLGASMERQPGEDSPICQNLFLVNSTKSSGDYDSHFWDPGKKL